MESVYGDADVPTVVELAQNQIKAFREVGRDADRGAAAVPRRLGLRARVTAATNKAETGLQRVLRLDPVGNQGVIAENDPAEQESRSIGTR